MLAPCMHRCMQAGAKEFEKLPQNTLTLVGNLGMDIAIKASMNGNSFGRSTLVVNILDPNGVDLTTTWWTLVSRCG